MAATTSSFNLNPAPTSGQGAFGAVPGQLGLPNSTYSQLTQNIPGFSGLNSATVNSIGSQLSGNLSQGTQNLLQDKAAAFGVSAGVPGGTPGNTLTTQNLLNNLGLTSEQLNQQGVANYNQFSNLLGQQQISPELQSNIAETNSINAAAPDPAAAQNYALQLYQEYMNLQNPSGGKSVGADAPGTLASATKAGGGEAFLPAGSTDWRPGSGFAP